MKKLSKFGIFFDVDGVLRKGLRPIKGAKESIINLRKRDIPMNIITNGGGDLEKDRAEGLNKLLNINENEYKIKEKELIMSHTPFKKFLPSHKDKLIYVSGYTNKIIDIMNSYGFSKFITNNEYFQLYQHSFPLHLQNSSIEEQESTRRIVEERLGISLPRNKYNQFEPFLKIDTIFLMCDIDIWEKNVQAIVDILISSDGIVGNVDLSSKQYVDLILSSNDLHYKDDFRLNRIASGGFYSSLETLFKRIYKKDIQYTIIGKPSHIIFDYAKDNINSYHPCDRFYMIGDNPEVDIKGANNSGINSVLVRTGVYNKNHNCVENPASMIADDVNEAIEMIIKKEELI